MLTMTLTERLRLISTGARLADLERKDIADAADEIEHLKRQIDRTAEAKDFRYTLTVHSDDYGKMEALCELASLIDGKTNWEVRD